MPRLNVQIPTEDGHASGTLHVPDSGGSSASGPDSGGSWPGVVMFPDAGGLRETFQEMGDHLASLGYVTLVPDVYYRAGDWAPFDMATAFSDEKERTRLFALMGSLTNERIIADAGAYADFLLARPEVSGTAIGTTGYCMGGRMSMLAAGGIGAKVGAAASFHGGGIAVADAPTSPHLAADRITATVYVAGAVEDRSFTPEQAELLDGALTAAGVTHTVEFYPAHHGFAVPDNDTYDEAASARHWAALQQLYQAAL
jgi:carboxymethylenebutenolidase